MKTTYALFGALMLLFSLGLLMVFNTTSAEVIDKHIGINPHLAMIRQVCFAALGIGLGGLVYWIGYKKLIDYGFVLYLGCLIALGLVFAPKIGMQINGANRWLNIFGISLQPSEFVKIVIPLYYLYLFKNTTMNRNFISFCKWQSLIMIPIFMILVEPDNGTAAILLASVVVLFFLTRVKWTYWAVPILCITLLGASVGFGMKHVRDRITIYLHPEADLLGKGHQPYQAKIAAGSGGVFGRGLGESLQKLNYLPEARSDYIAAIYAEEFGFIGMFSLIVLYLLIATLGFRIATLSKDEDGYYLATILTFLFAFQAFLNLGIVAGVLPSKGTNLPFFSQGGSSLLTNIIIIACLINIHVQGKRRAIPIDTISRERKK